MKKDIFKKRLRSSNADFLNLPPEKIILKVDQDNPERFKHAISSITFSEPIVEGHELYVGETNSSGWRGKRFTCVLNLIELCNDSIWNKTEITDVLTQIQNGKNFTTDDYSFAKKKDDNGKVKMTEKAGHFSFNGDGRLFKFIYFLEKNSRHNSRLSLIINPNYWGEKGSLHETVNAIMKSKSYSEIDQDIACVSNPHFIYLYALIKNTQDKENYPLYFKEWQKVFEFYNEIKSGKEGYDRFVDFYQKISIPKKHKETKYNLFSALIDVLKKRFIDKTQSIVLGAINSKPDYELASAMGRNLNKIVCSPFDLRGGKKKESVEKRAAWFKSNYKSDADPDQTSHANDESSSISSQLNQILYGPPGTGKTYNMVNYSLSIINGGSAEDYDSNDKVLRRKYENQFRDLMVDGDERRIFFLTFHQSYAYEDFVLGISPDLEQDKLKFKRKKGVFYVACEKALANPDKNYVIIIDEINRANISRVFGELITLIESDKRIVGDKNLDEGMRLILPNAPESDDEDWEFARAFGVPKNLYILGTMNTADKSIAALDIALRRRFRFIPKYPDSSKVEDSMLKEVMEKINAEILKPDGEFERGADFTIGHSYFMNKGKDKLKEIMDYEIIPLLLEYYMNDFRKIERLLDEVLKSSDYRLESNQSNGVITVKKK